MFQGVCGGVATYLGVDATVVRIGFVVLAILGGVGIVAYGAAWLLVPEEGEPARTERTPWEIAGIVLLAVVLFGTLDVWDGGPTFPLLLLVLGAALVWGGGEDRRSSAPPAPHGAPPVAAPIVERGEGRWSWSPPPAPAATLAAPPAGPPRRTGRAVAVGLGGLLLAAAAMSAAVALSGEVDPTVTLGLSLAGFGALMAVGALGGWSRPLAFGAVPVVLALAAAAYVDVPIEGGVGDRSVRPARAEELVGEERLAIGALDLDLTGLDADELDGRTLEASVAMGELLVTVPAGVTVEVHAEVGAGLLEVFGEESDGTSVGIDRVSEGTGGDRLVLDLEVGLGHLEVVRGG